MTLFKGQNNFSPAGKALLKSMFTPQSIIFTFKHLFYKVSLKYIIIRRIFIYSPNVFALVLCPR